MGSNETAAPMEDRTTRRETALALSGTHGIVDRPMSGALRIPALDLPQFRVTAAQDYVRPGYAEHFACIGAACEDNCCKGWSVPIDQATYETYGTVPGLKEHIGTLVVLNTDHPTAADYARIPLTAQSECGFLDGEKMCGIQKEHGHEMLSSTCATYPRAVATNVGRVEKALNFSCPEAARVTLLNPNLLGGGVWKMQGLARYDFVTTRRPNFLPGAGQRLSRFEPRLAVREFALLLLSDRRYQLWQRLYLLGNLAWRLQSDCESSGRLPMEKWCEAYPDRVMELLHESARRAATESLRPVMDESSFEPDQQIQLVLEMLRIRFKEPPVPMRFLECVRDFQLGLGTATAGSEQEILAAYSTSYRRYYVPLMEQRPHLLENYVTNLVFKNNYPFGKAELPGRPKGPARSAETEHLALCVHVASAQTLLIGMAGHYREAFDTTHVVKLMQSQAKTLEHSYRSIEQILEFVETKQLNNPQGITRLLRTEALASFKDASLYRNAVPGSAEYSASRLAVGGGVSEVAPLLTADPGRVGNLNPGRSAAQP
jgi:lysine-N-methylase